MRRSVILRHVKQFGLGLAMCTGLLADVPKNNAQPPQTVASSEVAAADRAYQEVAAKNYADAIRDFRKALAADPSNVPWRKDLGFTCLAAGFQEDAVAEFERVYSEDPGDFGVALQLGYLSQQLHRNDEARKYFEAVARNAHIDLSTQAAKALAELQASQLRDRKQRGYELLAGNRRSEAIKAFEGIHNDDPSDGAVTLQLGYLYAAAGRPGKAKVMFAAAGQDGDSQVVAQANAGLRQVRRDSKLWFASFYAAPFYQSRFSNEINPINAKIGLSPSRYFQPYVGFRFSRDIRSQVGTLPQIFSDDSAVVSIGLQSALAHTGAVVYAEAGTAINLIGKKPRAASDYRVGIDWFRSWGSGLVPSGNAGHSLSFSGSAYAGGAFYSRYNRNVIGSAQLREGINLPPGRALPMQLFAAVNFVKDSNGNFYNNIVEVGPVLRIAPLRRLPSLSFEAQYLRGFYFTHDPTNPYGPRYGDFRLFLIWSRTF